MMRRVSLLVASGLLLLPSAPAIAHADLIAMSPSAGSTVATAPQQVELRFSEDMQSLGAMVAVLDPSGRAVSQGLTVEGTTVRVRLRPLSQPGVYHVNYRVLAADGHVVAASKTFTLELAATAVGLTGGQSQPEVSLIKKDSSSAGYWITGLLMLCAIGAVIAARRWRQSPPG